MEEDKHDTSPPLGPAKSFLHKGMLVSFDHLTYTVKNENSKAREEIKLLDDISGYFRSGELVALMGPSGCGKTTLLDVLAGRKTVGKITGEVKFGGVKPTKQFLRRYTGYVEQFDTLVPILTVAEMLMYTAELKLDIKTSKKEKKEAVENVIDSLALDTCRNTIIGSQLVRGISGGQAKRVNIGIALICNPRVLFLDEPTTGLDSFTANEVMSVVKNLASGGITVCATIHSPTQYTFSLFGRLLILLRGQTCYFGKNGQPAVDYLRESTSTLSLRATVDSNEASIAEWITDMTVVADRTGQSKALADIYDSSPLREHSEEELAVQLKATTSLPKETLKMLQVKRETTTPFWYALLVMIRYRMLRNYTLIEFYAAHTAPWFFQSLIMMSTFWAVGVNVTAATVTNVAGIIFFWAATPAFGAAAFVPQIMIGRPLYFRERNDGMYRAITYLAYLMIEEIVVAVPVTLSVCAIMWFGLQLAGSFLVWYISFLLMYIAGIAVSYALCSISPNIDTANALVPIFGVCCLFLSGFLIRTPSMGWWWRWAVYATPTYYAFGCQMSNYFAGERNVVFVDGQTVTQYYALDWLTSWEFIGMQCIFPVVYLFCAWLALEFKTSIKR